MQQPPTDAGVTDDVDRRWSGVWRPVVGAAAVAASLSVTITFEARPVPLVTSNFTHLQLSWGEIGAAIVVAAWAAAALVARRRWWWGPWFLVLPATVILGAAWLSVLPAIDPPLAAWNAARLTIAVGFGIVAANIAATGPLAAAMLAVIVLHGVVALAQVGSQHSLGLGWLGERHLAPGVEAASTVSAADGRALLRAYGLAGSPNILGGILAAAIAGLAFAAWRGRLARVAVAAGLALAAAALVVSFSRAGWLGAGVGLTVGLWVGSRGDPGAVRGVAARAAPAIVVTVALVVAMAPFLVARVTASPEVPNEVRSIEERLALNGETLAVLAERPVVGTGLGLLPLALAERFPDSPFGRSPAHLVPLTAAAEIGVVGGAALVVLLVVPWVALAADRRRGSGRLALASGALAVLVVVGLFDYYPWSSPVGRLWLWLVLGAWAGAWRAARQPAA